MMSLPAPDLVSENPSPDTPPIVKFPFVMVTEREAFMETAPVPKLKSFDPTNSKSAFQFWAFNADRTTVEPLVLLRVPPLMEKVPLPSALALLRFRVPLFKTPPPE